MRLAILVLVASALTAEAQNRDGWKVVGQIGGPTQGIAVQGNYAYAGVGMQLVILDVSNPSDLREIGATTPFPHAVEDVALSGAFAYVAAGSAGLRVVDVSTPTSPIEIGAWDSPGYAQGVTVAGTIAYVADGPYGLRLVDISKASQPAQLGSAYPMNYAFDVAVQEHYAYIAAAGAGLLIADVSDPTHPVEVGSLVTNGYAYGLAVAGSTVYLADGPEGVKTVNVADPAHSTLVGTYKTPGWAFGVTISGTTAYVADAFGGLRVLDVTNAAHPVEVGSSRAKGGHAANVAVAGNTAFVADRNWGVRAVNLSAGPDLPQVGSFHPVGYVEGVAVSGAYAFIADANSGFFVIDISDPTRPRQVGTLVVDGNSKDVAVRGAFAYLTTKGGRGSSGLHVIDVSDFTRPARVGYLDTLGQPKGLDIAGDHAYVAAENGLEILNISDPQAPVRSAFLRTKEKESDLETLVGVTVSGTLAYVSLERGGLAIVDVSDPGTPVRLGSFTPGSSFFIRNIAVSANRAYVADAGYGLRILDVSDPSHPVVMGSLQTTGGQTVALAGSLAYLACGDAGLLAIDISDPNGPIPAGRYRTAGYTRVAAVAGGRTYLADGPSGLLILERAAGASGNQTLDQTGRTELAGRPPSAGGHFSHPPPPPELRSVTTAGATSTGASAAPSCLVTSVGDSGNGTLRQCLQTAGAGTTITFDPAIFPSAVPGSIRLANGLPGIPGGVVIDGSDAGVILDGSGVSTQPGNALVDGLSIRTDGTTIRGLQIVGFPGSGIKIHGSQNVIGGDRTLGRGPTGQGNVISGNKYAGIMISSGDSGTGASGNVVVGNFIGTDASGTKAMGNTMDGVWIQAANNRIGGLDLPDRNIVSANGMSGILTNGQSTENLIAGNYVGTDVTGTYALGNQSSGMMIALGSFGNVYQGNLISGNLGAGVGIDDQGSSYNEILGNRIGTDATGTKAVPNSNHGVWINEPLSAYNRIGGTRPEERNIVSGNLLNGMAILSSGNLVLGNFVGTDITGRNPLGNAGHGVDVSRSPNMLGGVTPAEANVIAANGGFGVGAGGDYNTILGNYIGTDPSGLVALGNTLRGVTLGGRQSIVQANVLAHTARSAVHGGEGSGVSFSAESSCTIRRNSIHHNAGVGIDTTSEPGAPVITSATLTSVSGTACGGCEVEIFSDSEDEGGLFEGSTVADGSGLFAFTKATLTGPNVTATATGSGGSTSAFSNPMTLPPKPPRRRAVRGF